jgi:hypothetical protein
MIVPVVTIVFHTSSKNVQVKFLIDNVDQHVGQSNGTLVKANMAVGAYDIQQTISTVDGSLAGGEWCETTVSEEGQPGAIFTIPKILNTISLGQSSDTAYGTLKVV